MPFFMKRKRELRRVPSPAHSHFDASLPITKSHLRTKFFGLVLTALEYFFHLKCPRNFFFEKSGMLTIPKQELVVYVIWCLTYCKHTRAIVIYSHWEPSLPNAPGKDKIWEEASPEAKRSGS